MTRDEILERLEELAKLRARARHAQIDYEEEAAQLFQDIIEYGMDKPKEN